MTKHIQAVVEDEVHRALTILAPQKDKTLGQLIETAVEEYIEKEEKSNEVSKGSVRRD